MKSSAFKQIEIILREYPRYESYIKKREEELLNPYSPGDENIGGGRGNLMSSPTEIKAIRLADDRVLARLKFQRDAVKRVYEIAEPITQRIIYEYYFVSRRTKTWIGIAKEVHLEERQCRRRRDAFFEKVADELGIMK